MNRPANITKNENTSEIINLLPEIGKEAMQQEILQGLTSTPKYIPSKYFYDKKGSELFEEITRLEEYYPTRTEIEIISSLWDKLHLDGNELHIIELGSGDASKIRLLLDQIPKEKPGLIHYYPVDISESAITGACENLCAIFPELQVTGIVADFVHQLNLLPNPGNRFFCFFGSTIGNLDTHEIKTFLHGLSTSMQKGDHLLLGLDRVKDTRVLEKAYNDKNGVTARFNKNILLVANELLDANFDPASFAHLAFFNKDKQRIEMHLQAEKDMVIHLGYNGQKICLAKNETIHTENSHKFDARQINEIAAGNGMRIEQQFSDAKGWFSLIHFRK